MVEHPTLPRADDAVVPIEKLRDDVDVGGFPDLLPEWLSVMPITQHAVLDVVEFLTDSGRWPAGTVGTVVEADASQALVEISDDRGHALDFVSLPHEALTPASSSPRLRAAS